MPTSGSGGGWEVGLGAAGEMLRLLESFWMLLRQSFWSQPRYLEQLPQSSVCWFFLLPCRMRLPPGITSQLDGIQALAPSSAFRGPQIKPVLYVTWTFPGSSGQHYPSGLIIYLQLCAVIRVALGATQVPATKWPSSSSSGIRV